jgi:hypothetical protein
MTCLMSLGFVAMIAGATVGLTRLFELMPL